MYYLLHFTSQHCWILYSVYSTLFSHFIGNTCLFMYLTRLIRWQQSNGLLRYRVRELICVHVKHQNASEMWSLWLWPWLAFEYFKICWDPHGIFTHNSLKSWHRMVWKFKRHSVRGQSWMAWLVQADRKPQITHCGEQKSISASTMHQILRQSQPQH